MKRKLVKRMRRSLHGAVLWSMISGMTLASVAQANIQLPFEPGRSWYVCKGYNIEGYANDPHFGNPVMDLTVAPNARGLNGCGLGPDASSGQSVLAPIAGKVTWFKNRNDMVCVTADDRKTSIGIGHLRPSTRYNHPEKSNHIQAGEGLGLVAAPYEVENGGYAHIHIQAHAVSDCNGNLVPFDDAHGMRLQNAQDMPYTGEWDQWAGVKLTNAPLPFPIGSLIRLQGTTTERPVYLVSVDATGNIVKRHVANENTMTLNKFSFGDVADVESSILALYPAGIDINSRVTRDDLKEGELMRIQGDNVKVYVVSEGKLHHLDMASEEFLKAGYSFEGIKEVGNSYVNFIGSPLTFAAFTACVQPPPNVPLAGVGSEFTLTARTPLPYGHYDVDPFVIPYRLNDTNNVSPFSSK